MIKTINIRNGLPLTITFVVLASFSCRKDNEVSPTPVNLPSSDYTSFVFNCDTLGPQPSMGWQDTTTDMRRNIRMWALNPVNEIEIIYTNYKSELLNYNLRTKQHMLLDKNLGGYFKVSKDGWITYSKLDLNIYISKSNGDSLKRITNNGNSTYPQWDYTGQYIYCRDNSANKVYKLDMKGNYQDTLEGGLIVCSQKSSNYLKSSGNGIYYVNNLTNIETLLFTNNSGIYLTVMSYDDEFVIWNNGQSLQRYNMETKSLDTLVKFCENFDIFGLNISPNSNKLTGSYAFRKQVVKPYKLLHEDLPIEFNISTSEWRKLNVQY